MLQVNNVFGLYGIDIVVKSADGKILDDGALYKIKNETIIVQRKINSLESGEVHQRTLPITQ